MKEQRYILEYNITAEIDGKRYYTPQMDACNVKDQELFYDTFTRESGGTELNRKEIDKVVEKRMGLRLSHSQIYR